MSRCNQLRQPYDSRKAMQMSLREIQGWFLQTYDN